jgi:peptidoglycan-associated lipoprotein
VKHSTLGLFVGVALMVGSLTLGGCATEDYVDSHIAPVQAQVNGLQTNVTAMQGQLTDQQAHLGKLDDATQQAQASADAANKLAQGKFVYQAVLTDNSVKFATGKATLSSESQARLLELANKLNSENKNVYLEIQGKTDSRGSVAYNQQLGWARAAAVQRFLNDQGKVALNRMDIISYGKEKPEASNDTPQGMAENRSVVIIAMQ